MIWFGVLDLTDLLIMIRRSLFWKEIKMTRFFCVEDQDSKSIEDQFSAKDYVAPLLALFIGPPFESDK